MTTEHTEEHCGTDECPRCAAVYEMLRRFQIRPMPNRFSRLFQLAEHAVELEESECLHEKKINSFSVQDLLERAKKRNEEAQKYVMETGLCFNCEKNPVKPGCLQCQECLDALEECVKPLRGTPGFYEL